MNQIIVNQTKTYNIAANIEKTDPPILNAVSIINNIPREYLRLTIVATYDEAAVDFVDGAQIDILQPIIGGDGTQTSEYTEIPWYDFDTAGDIIDHRNGTVTVFMYKKSEAERAIKDLAIIVEGVEECSLTREQAVSLRKIIEKAVQSLDDSDALEAVTLYEKWSGDSKQYKAGRRLQYDGILYTVLQDHTSQPTWTPTDAPSLFAKVLIPDPSVIPEWEQPDSTNPFMKGNKVTHNGKTWISDIDNNVWEPGVYGWHEVAE